MELMYETLEIGRFQYPQTILHRKYQHFNMLFLRWVTMQAICLQYSDKQRNLYVIYEIVQSICNISFVSRPIGYNRFPVRLAGRGRRLNWGSSPDSTTKNEDPCHRRWGTIKSPLCANAICTQNIQKIRCKTQAYGPIVCLLFVETVM